MTSRRLFLRAVSTGLLASTTARFASAVPAGRRRRQTDHEIPVHGHAWPAAIQPTPPVCEGRRTGTLAMVKGWGLTDLELAGTYGMSVADYAALLKKTGLRAVSTHADFDKLADGIDGVIADARTFGVEYPVCVDPAWRSIHGRRRGQGGDGVQRRRQEGQAAGLRFFYHIHGYEFQAAGDGTLFDSIAAVPTRRSSPSRWTCSGPCAAAPSRWTCSRSIPIGSRSRTSRTSGRAPPSATDGPRARRFERAARRRADRLGADYPGSE